MFDHWLPENPDPGFDVSLLRNKIGELESEISRLKSQAETDAHSIAQAGRDRDEALRKLEAALLENQELQHELARLKRNEKCYGCGHSRENHDRSGCLVWVEADAHRKCLCKVWTDSEKL